MSPTESDSVLSPRAQHTAARDTFPHPCERSGFLRPAVISHRVAQDSTLKPRQHIHERTRRHQLSDGRRMGTAGDQPRTGCKNSVLISICTQHDHTSTVIGCRGRDVSESVRRLMINTAELIKHSNEPSLPLNHLRVLSETEDSNGRNMCQSPGEKMFKTPARVRFEVFSDARCDVAERAAKHMCDILMRRYDVHGQGSHRLLIPLMRKVMRAD